MKYLYENYSIKYFRCQDTNFLTIDRKTLETLANLIDSLNVDIIAMQEISAGTTITKEMIDIRRPGSGIQPIHYDEIIGKKVSRDIQKEEPLRWEMIE